MDFGQAYALALNTPTKALSEAWQTCEDGALGCARGERPMTIREAGALAELHGLKLLDILTV